MFLLIIFSPPSPTSCLCFLSAPLLTYCNKWIPLLSIIQHSVSLWMQGEQRAMGNVLFLLGAGRARPANTFQWDSRDPCYYFENMPYNSSQDKLSVVCCVWRHLATFLSHLAKPRGNTQHPHLVHGQGMGCAPSLGCRRALLPLLSPVSTPSLAHLMSTWQILVPFKFLLFQLCYHHLYSICHFDSFLRALSSMSFVQFSTYIQANILQIFIHTSLSIFIYNMNALTLFVYFYSSCCGNIFTLHLLTVYINIYI